jgi:hypothetical protein
MIFIRPLKPATILFIRFRSNYGRVDVSEIVLALFFALAAALFCRLIKRKNFILHE